MVFHVGNGCPPANNGNPIHHITHSDATPEMSLWESAKVFFCLTHQPEAQECILKIFHLPTEATREDMANIFEQLRTFANPGCRENIQSGRHGENHFCILNENNREILSVTLEAGERYTVQCPEYTETHILTMDTERGDECATHTEGANGTPRISHAPTTPQTAEDYEAVWSAWEKAAPPGKAEDSAKVVNILRDCQSRESAKINLNGLDISSLPDHLPQCIREININGTLLTSLPALPDSLKWLKVTDTPLSSLPALPDSLEWLRVTNTPLSSLPALPDSLEWLRVTNTPLSSLPPLPENLRRLKVADTQLTSLPPLPDSLQSLEVTDTPLSSLPPLPENLTELRLDNNQLTSLPALPENLRWLEVADTQLTSLPDLTSLVILTIDGAPLSNLPPLPNCLVGLTIHNTPLSNLPPLPNCLVDLTIHNTPLSNLPDHLPGSLEILKIDKTPLTSLPPLPDRLRYLEVTETPLTSLPALPDRLVLLKVTETPLTSLPPLPDRLERLTVTDTPLTSLPALPENLKELTVTETQLISLPENIAHLSATATVTLNNNPLLERTLRDLQAIASDPGYQGPRIRFNMAGPFVPRETRALHLAVADWLTAAKQGETAPADRWQAFGQQNNAASFSDFLDRLHHTDNCKKDPGFKTQISSWLAQLAEDDALREKTFAMAKEATSSCEDRVTLALNQMKTVQLLHNAEKGEFNEDLPGLVSVGREMFRQEKLEQIAREKVKTLRFVDEIEVYLGYQNKLKRQLELTSVTAKMQFFGVSHITPSDLKAAEMQVKTAENSEFSEWILQWEPVRSILKHKEPARWEALCEKKISDYDDTYQSLKEGVVKNKLDGDIDAERTIGTEAMKRAEQAFLDGLRPLADEMLGRYLKARWPLTESGPSL